MTDRLDIKQGAPLCCITALARPGWMSAGTQPAKVSRKAASRRWQVRLDYAANANQNPPSLDAVETFDP
jgi:hypothetical protein